MAAINFFWGLAVGIGFYAVGQYRFKKQLKETLKSYGSNTEREVSLPLQSLIRRELIDLDRQRKKLEQDKQSWQKLIEQAPIGYLQVDGDNQLLGCNQTAKDLLRIDSRRSQRVRLLLELVRSYDLDTLIEKTRKSLRPQEKEWVFYFTRYVSADDVESNTNNYSSQQIVESIALKGYGFPLSNQQVGVFIEDRQPLVELSQSRDRTLSDLTHELRTPLTSISLVAENLLHRLQNPERRWVERMLQEANRLIELVQEWLDLTQLQNAPERTLKYETIVIHDLIESVWSTLEPIAHRKKAVLSYQGDRSITIKGDRSRLIQVFLNLLDNAIKHNPSEREIVVRVALTPQQDSSSNKVKIDIIDSGVGFQASDLPYIFERLYRGDKSRTRERDSKDSSLDGSGLGLAIVEQIVQAHKGAIAAKNHPIGGAWMEILLPTIEE